MTRYTVLFLSLLSVVAAATGSTAKDVENGICKPVTLIFARGSTETGNMGTVVGPPLANAMMAALGAGQVAVQGVNYPADIPGAVTGALNPKDAAGSKNMAMFAQMVATACPNSKVVLSGYSQGAEQVRGALMNLGAQNNVVAAVTFGDPLQTQQFANIPKANTKINCNQDDPVCMSQFIITAAHLSYGTTGAIGDSVNFITSVIGSPTTNTGGLVSTTTIPQSVGSVAGGKGKRMVEFKA